MSFLDELFAEPQPSVSVEALWAEVLGGPAPELPLPSVADDAIEIVPALPATAPKRSRAWSGQQVAIFGWFADGTGNLIARARAGTGKTTTILEAVISYAREHRILLVAFGKANAKELQDRIPPGSRARARTCHSLGRGIVLRHWPATKLDEHRGSRLAEAALAVVVPEVAKEIAAQPVPKPPAKLPPMPVLPAPKAVKSRVRQLASSAKNCTPLVPFDAVEQMMDLALDFDLEPSWQEEEKGYGLELVARAALKALELACICDGTYDFDDMVYLPLRNDWARPMFELVVIDEAQDFNLANLLLARAVCEPTGRIVVVGDDRQAIFAFRGADAGSLDRMKCELNADELGLSVSYRCPRRVIALAQALVPDITAAEDAPEGSVLEADWGEMLEMARPGDFILSRTNAPLVRICLALLRRGKRAHVKGRDVQGAVRRLLDLAEDAGVVSLSGLGRWVDGWETREVERLDEDDPRRDAKLARIEDLAETVRALAEGVASLGGLRKRLAELCVEENGDAKVDWSEFVICSTVHKAKGLERDRVFVLSKTLYPARATDLREEQNIEYVAITRTKKTLVWVG